MSGYEAMRSDSFHSPGLAIDNELFSEILSYYSDEAFNIDNVSLDSDDAHLEVLAQSSHDVEPDLDRALDQLWSEFFHSMPNKKIPSI
jgi:hypothetical protein